MENNGNIEDANDVYFKSLPPGYHFCPTDEELVNVYLKKKVLNETLPRNQIRDLYFYDYSPQILSKMFKLRRESVWYFFTQRIKKYPKGTRPDRSVHDEGFWKPMGADVPIYSNGEEIGCKKSLVFFKGSTGKRKGKGKEKVEEKEVEPPVKTNWMMHEYRYGKRVDPRPSTNPNDKELDKWVLCKMYEKAAGKANGEQQYEDNGDIIVDNEGVVLLPNTTAQSVLVQDPQLPPLPSTTFDTMSSAMLTYPRYGYGYGVPTNGVVLPNGLNVGSPLLLDDISDYLPLFDSLVGDDYDMMPMLPSDTTHLELSSNDNKGGPS